MRHDIDIIKERIRALVPEVQIEQLQVVHPGVDDDGLWFFRRTGKKEEIQLESSTHNVPFIIESDVSPASTALSIDEAVEAVQRFFSKS